MLCENLYCFFIQNKLGFVANNWMIEIVGFGGIVMRKSIMIIRKSCFFAKSNLFFILGIMFFVGCVYSDSNVDYSRRESHTLSSSKPAYVFVVNSKTGEWRLADVDTVIQETENQIEQLRYEDDEYESNKLRSTEILERALILLKKTASLGVDTIKLGYSIVCFVADDIMFPVIRKVFFDSDERLLVRSDGVKEYALKFIEGKITGEEEQKLRLLLQKKLGLAEELDILDMLICCYEEQIVELQRK